MSRKKTFGNLFAVLLLAAAAGCCAEPPRPAGPEAARIRLTEKDDGRQLQLVRGDTLTVELESNPTTGYRWQIADAGKNGVLKAESVEFLAPETDRCGAPGREKLSFVPAAAGETTLRLVYVRPWEKDQPPARSFRVTVSVAEQEQR